MTLLIYPTLFYKLSTADFARRTAGVGEQIRMHFLAKDKDKPKTAWYLFEEKVPEPVVAAADDLHMTDAKLTRKAYKYMGYFNGHAQAFDANVPVDGLAANRTAQIGVVRVDPFLVKMIANFGEKHEHRLFLEFDGKPDVALVGRLFVGRLLNMRHSEPFSHFGEHMSGKSAKS